MESDLSQAFWVFSTQNSFIKPYDTTSLRGAQYQDKGLLKTGILIDLQLPNAID